MARYVVLHGTLNSGSFYPDSGSRYYVYSNLIYSVGFAKLTTTGYPHLIEFIPDKISEEEV